MFPSAMFGGQGNTDDLLSELRQLWFHECVQSFVRTICLKTELPKESFDPERWLQEDPSKESILQAATSLPLIILIQLCHFILCQNKSNLTFTQFKSHFHHFIGHSQGIITAYIVKSSESEEQLIENARIVIELLHKVGLECSKVLEGIVNDYDDEGRKGNWMMSISGLEKPELESEIDSYQKMMNNEIGLYLAIKNGLKHLVVASTPSNLAKFQKYLSMRYPDDNSTQLRIPFNERKAVVRCRFLPVKLPFHSPLLQSALNSTANLFSEDNKALIALITEILTEYIDWPKTLLEIAGDKKVLFVDFGPGDDTGVAVLCDRILRGRGSKIVLCGDKEHLIDFNQQEELTWKELFQPKLVEFEEKKLICTKFTNLFGVPPVMVAGMTPTTVDGTFVTAVMNAGYHVELAGGGHFTERMLHDKIDQIIREVTEEGRGITINMLFLNQQQWAFQYPLILELSERGYPIDGITVAAGVPSLDLATSIITDLQRVGVRYVAFKPGSTNAILEVIEIAKRNPSFPIVLQWTGGRAGGHHSFEDVHQPILETYHLIRRQNNIVLVAGSGFGDGEGSWPYLNGDWSTKYNFPEMPFDAILLGSRMLVSLESRASFPVKELLVNTPGIDQETQWIESYKSPVGGVVTVVSEMGEPIHKIATRAVLLWKEFDETVFKLPHGERLPFLDSNKEYIKRRLNEDSHRPWFGQLNDGTCVDLAEMSYYSILRRFVDFTFREDTWLDPSMALIFMDFCQRALERAGKQKSMSSQVNPLEWLPFHQEELTFPILPDDEQYFIQLCKRGGQKPVPFIPCLDENFETWFKKDSLWQAENINFVLNNDPQRTCILQGPVALKYSKQVNQPVKDILDEINQYYIDQLGEMGEKGLESGTDLKHLLMDTEYFWKKKRRLSNWIKPIIEKCDCKFKDDQVEIKERINGKCLLKLEKVSSSLLSCTLIEGSNELKVNFKVVGFGENKKILEIADQEDQSESLLYWNLWQKSTSSSIESFAEMSSRTAEFTSQKTILEESVKQFCKITGLKCAKSRIPEDFAIVLVWEDVSSCLFTKDAKGDFLNLVHLSNHIHIPDGATPMAYGENVICRTRIVYVKQTLAGKLVRVESRIYSTGNELKFICIGEFLFRGFTVSKEDLFEKGEMNFKVQLRNEQDLSTLLSASWIKLEGEKALSLPANLSSNVIFEHTLSKEGQILNMMVSGKVKNDGEIIGSIEYECQNQEGINPVIEFFSKLTPFNQGPLSGKKNELIGKFTSPKCNEDYSKVSGDYNPIHTNVLFASRAGFPACITHGMWTSAAIKSLCQSHFPSQRILKYLIRFDSPLMAESTVEVHCWKKMISDGSIQYEFHGKCNGVKIVSGEFTIESRKTAVLFTGQGSQEVGMGMSLYNVSATAQRVWDEAEGYFMNKYGFSIMEIVRNNPKTLTVDFTTLKGQKIRENYMNIFYERQSEGFSEIKLIFEDINTLTPSYTFYSAKGLLHATQFTQPALTLMELAAFSDMQSRGLIPSNCLFAGHSLGEYAALASIGKVLTIPQLCEVVFYRGLCMQQAVERDAEGNSNYAMIAVNPSKVRKTEDDLKSLISAIIQANAGRGLLEIVNYNIQNSQYVVAGSLLELKLLSHFMEVKNATADDISKEMKVIDLKAPLVRKNAIIPLQGIDVPFHSSYLRGGVDSFRKCLKGFLTDVNLDVNLLTDRYIPNLTAIPFEPSLKYAQKVLQYSGSPVLKELIESKKSTDISEMTRTLLIELLAYQFASAVQWIDTQKLMLNNVERTIEIGPSPVLTSISERNYQIFYKERDEIMGRTVEFLHVSRDEGKIMFEDDESSNLTNYSIENSEISESKPNVEKSDNSEKKSTRRRLPKAVAKISELPISVSDILFPLVASKLRVKVGEVAKHKSIKQLAGGKSTVQNEILADLYKEFGNSLPEKSEEIALEHLGSKMDGAFGKKAGPVTSAAISRMISTKMPAGFSSSSISSYLQQTLGLEGHALEHALIIAWSHEPQGRFASEDAAKEWLKTILSKYLQDNGISLNSSQDEEGEESCDLMISAEAVKAISSKNDRLLYKQLELLASHLNVCLHKDILLPSNGSSTSFSIESLALEELGVEYLERVKPLFTKNKCRSYKSVWNWTRQQIYRIFCSAKSYENDLDRSILQRRLNIKTKPYVAYYGKIYGDRGDLRAIDTFSTIWQCDDFGSLMQGTVNYTQKLMDALNKCKSDEGISLVNKRVLLTGAGKNSIGEALLQRLLCGGAKIVVTTSTFSPSVANNFQQIYQKWATNGAELILVPFNQASSKDINSLMEFIQNELGWLIDVFIPMAAMPENGRNMEDIDGESEVAHRMMMTNVLRMIGRLSSLQSSHQCTVILPLSPNHGNFGGDGLYGESKIGLETLFNRWYSEPWKDNIGIIGVVIGWTKGTGLMKGNDALADNVERELDIKTFGVDEMATRIFALLDSDIRSISQSGPIKAIFDGGLSKVSELGPKLREIRQRLEGRNESSSSNSKEALPISMRLLQRKRHGRLTWPLLAEFKDIGKKNESLLDLSQIVVVTGFGEVGPYGSSRQRWEMESIGKYSLDCFIELAWIMGLIKYDKERGNWIDVKTGIKVEEHEVESKYGNLIREHTGIRYINSELFGGYDPQKRRLLSEVVINEDLPAFETSREEAESFKKLHGEYAEMWGEGTSNNKWVRLKKGATLFIPKSTHLDRQVAGQIPLGWNAERYGIPKDIVDQVDPVTLYALVSVAEAFLSSGIIDPYELYEHVHVSEVGITAGGGEGGMLSNRRIFRDRFLDRPVQSDILQESFINTMPAWINMLLLSASGPIKTPVGACATAIQSIDIAIETILSGKAKVVITGGYDDFQEESSVEFASMQATSNSVKEVEAGRMVREMSRPATSSRSGFMESQGAGMQILMTAELALQMGLPIYGIVAGTNMAMDKAGRSVPAPGKGLLTTSRKVINNDKCERNNLLDIEMRRQLLTKFIQSSRQVITDSDQLFENSKDLYQVLIQREKEERKFWSMDYLRGNVHIAPLEGALSMYGLTVNDIDVASFHGTGTKANDSNETAVVNLQMRHLGRTSGNLLPCVFQKHLTGHPKGAAAAWMLNGVLQMMRDGIIPGNRNADDIDGEIEKCDYLVFLNEQVEMNRPIKAALLKSFGFGQVGGEALIINPQLIYSLIDEETYGKYVERRRERLVEANRHFQNILLGNRRMVEVKEASPFGTTPEETVYLNPTMRARQLNGNWQMQPDLTSSMNSTLNKTKGIGFDIQLISEINWQDSNFIEHNYTQNEIEYCKRQADPGSSFAGKWAAKEAVFKCLSSIGQSGLLNRVAGSLNEIEILNGEEGVPYVKLSCDKSFNVDLKVSISHSGEYAAAIAIVTEARQ